MFPPFYRYPYYRNYPYYNTHYNLRPNTMNINNEKKEEPKKE